MYPSYQMIEVVWIDIVRAVVVEIPIKPPVMTIDLDGIAIFRGDYEKSFSNDFRWWCRYQVVSPDKAAGKTSRSTCR